MGGVLVEISDLLYVNRVGDNPRPVAKGVAEGVQVNFYAIDAALFDRELFAQGVGRFFRRLAVA